MSDGFLGRWSRRKQASQHGLPVEEPARAPAAPPPPPATVPGPGPEPTPAETTGRSEAPAPDAAPAAQPPEAPPPTLNDVRALDRESDFKPFVAQNVDPQVRNAAMKKLFFSNPHFNEIDWLDVYMDDYSIPSPLPATMLRQMASAKFMNLVPDEPPAATAGVPPDAGPAAATSANETLPASAPVGVAATPVSPPAPTQEDHDHTDLRLQQDHAAGPPGPGDGAG